MKRIAFWLKVFFSFLLFLLVYRLFLNFCGTSKFDLLVPMGIPAVVKIVLNVILACYVVLEYIMWLFMYFLGILIMDILEVFGIYLDKAPYPFIGVIMLLVIFRILWFLWKT